MWCALSTRQCPVGTGGLVHGCMRSPIWSDAAGGVYGGWVHAHPHHAVPIHALPRTAKCGRQADLVYSVKGLSALCLGCQEEGNTLGGGEHTDEEEDVSSLPHVDCSHNQEGVTHSQQGSIARSHDQQRQSLRQAGQAPRLEVASELAGPAPPGLQGAAAADAAAALGGNQGGCAAPLQGFSAPHEHGRHGGGGGGGSAPAAAHWWGGSGMDDDNVLQGYGTMDEGHDWGDRDALGGGPEQQQQQAQTQAQAQTQLPPRHNSLQQELLKTLKQSVRQQVRGASASVGVFTYGSRQPKEGAAPARPARHALLGAGTPINGRRHTHGWARGTPMGWRVQQHRHGRVVRPQCA